MRARRPQSDPIGWSAALAFAFLALAAFRLTLPTKLYFDEVHYVPVARMILAFKVPGNIEHPPLGKQLIAIGMALLGDKPLGWRIMPLLAGTLALFAGMRAMWFASCSRGASLLTGVYMATGFVLFVQTRIAMLDIFMVSFVLLAYWMCAGAMREAETARWRLAAAGASLGAALACKWNAVPLAVLPGLAFLVIRTWSEGWRFAWTRRGPPVPGISIIEAVAWLGLLPLLVYAATFWPFAAMPGGETVFTKTNYLADLWALHQRMFDLQSQLKTPHPYQSTWTDWVIDRRVVWYLFEKVDGAQRGIVLLGNPLTMLAGLPAVLWCAWAGVACRRRDALAVAVLYTASLGMWVIAPKPVQFYYHYLLPSCFLFAALALATEALWRRGWRLPAGALVLGAVGLFAYFYPVLTGAPLAHEQEYLIWAWFPGWR